MTHDWNIYETFTITFAVMHIVFVQTFIAGDERCSWSVHTVVADRPTHCAFVRNHGDEVLCIEPGRAGRSRRPLWNLRYGAFA